MASYKTASYLAKSESETFDAINNPGAATPFSGIYRCTGCGKEIVSEEQKPLPPQNHHQHTASQGEIRWKMIVYADHKPK